MKGLFTVDRGIFENPIFKREAFTEVQAFIWLVSEASYQDRTVRGVKGPIELKRGQLTHSLRFMADKWRWTYSRVNRFLKRLEIETAIETATETDQNVITICNYDIYQDFETYRETVHEVQQSKQQRNSAETAAKQRRTPEGTPEGIKDKDIGHSGNADLSLFDDDPEQESLPAFLDRTDEHKAVGMWNDVAEKHGLPQCQKLTDTRRSKIRKRLKDCGGLEGWQLAMGKIGAADWMHGSNNRGWKADIDFVLQEKSFTRLMEGSYDRTDPPPGGDGGGSIMDAFDDIRGNA